MTIIRVVVIIETIQIINISNQTINEEINLNNVEFLKIFDGGVQKVTWELFIGDFAPIGITIGFRRGDKKSIPFNFIIFVI